MDACLLYNIKIPFIMLCIPVLDMLARVGMQAAQRDT